MFLLVPPHTIFSHSNLTLVFTVQGADVTDYEGIEKCRQLMLHAYMYHMRKNNQITTGRAEKLLAFLQNRNLYQLSENSTMFFRY